MFFGYVSSLFWKRSRENVVFGAWFGKKFADNSRYLYQYLSENKREQNLKHVVWITSNPAVNRELNYLGYESYLSDSSEAIYFLKHSKIHFICNNSDDNGYGTDIPCEYSYGAVKVNLWHGVGVVKGVGAMSKPNRIQKEAHPIRCVIKDMITYSFLYKSLFGGKGGWKNCYYLVPSNLGKRQLGDMFHIKSKQFILTGQPRTCSCPRYLEREEILIAKIKLFSKAILYLPTFRTKCENENYSKLSGQLKEFIEKNDLLWMEKPHDADKSNFKHEYSPNIITLESDFDINTLIPHIDILVTDYSSVMSDAKYWYKVVVLYTPDYNEYFEADNGLIEDCEILMSGPKYENTHSLMKGIELLLTNEKIGFSEGYDKFSYEELRHLILGSDRTMDQIWDDILANIKKKWMKGICGHII